MRPAPPSRGGGGAGGATSNTLSAMKQDKVWGEGVEVSRVEGVGWGAGLVFFLVGGGSLAWKGK